ncbi:MAG: hypothetical protein HOI23_15720, partial [Deltaproteobacteria bacterium]|nr:hypothetical protein [Deltaproteobacteria bacterium]
MHSNSVLSAGTFDSKELGAGRTVVPGGPPPKAERQDLSNEVLQSRVLSPELRAAESFDAQEMIHAQTWSKVLGFLCAITGALIGLVEGHPDLKLAAQVACFVLVPVCFWVAQRAAQPSGYTRFVYR